MTVSNKKADAERNKESEKDCEQDQNIPSIFSSDKKFNRTENRTQYSRESRVPEIA